MSREQFEEWWRSQFSYRASDKPASKKAWEARQPEIDELREENARLREALHEMVYEDGGVWRAGMMEDSDVSDVIGDLLDAAMQEGNRNLP